ncbi:MAG: decarboxylating 6-phosphogluconate dehydrogenase [Actinobacteria bacterium]|nr:decarboxylating 6-phosphogluconate dehydrogenase [Actinomycetota bacterium]
MKLGMVGLGRMGGNMTIRLIRQGHEVVAFDAFPEARDRVAAEGAEPVASLEAVVQALEPPRVVWIMLPAGTVTEETLATLKELLGTGDTIIDGGNSKYTETIRRSGELAEHGIAFLDCGTSGGVWGLDNGYCLMVGGDAKAFGAAEPIFAALAPESGYAHVGPSGAGHFVKMVHNGIEYGMLAAFGEGFEIMQASPFQLDLAEIAGIWRHGSVVRSWLLDLLVDAYQKDPGLEGVRGFVEDSGEGRWTLEAAVAEEVPAFTTAAALFLRFMSRQDESYAAKVIAALRQEFGGHAIKTAESLEAQPGGEL